MSLTTSLFLVSSCENVRVTAINDTEDTAVEEFPTCRSQSRIVACIVVYVCLSKHGKVFHFTFPQRRTVGGNQNELALGLSKTLDRCLVSQDGLPRLHHQLEPGVHALRTLFLHSKRKNKANMMRLYSLFGFRLVKKKERLPLWRSKFSQRSIITISGGQHKTLMPPPALSTYRLFASNHVCLLV